MPESVHILAFAGSLRKRSYNRRLLEIARDLVPEGCTYDIFHKMDMPLFNEDVEALGFPPVVAEFRAALRKADAFLIATPEYNSSITGVLKNALDWASRSENGKPSPLHLKPAAMIGAGGRSGTDRSQYHLRSILNHLNMYTVNKPEVVINMPGRIVFDDQGNLLDEIALGLIRQTLENLADLTRRLRD
jgi:chromate reductase